MSLLPPYANRELFSQHFLDRRLPAEPAWAEARAGAAPLLAALRALLAKERDKLPAYNEEQLRHHWIDPVLSILGTAWDPEPSLATDTGASEHPDYLLFADDAARDAARRQLDEGRVDAYGRAAAFVGEAKAWGTSFTAASSGQRTPRQQLTDYIHLSGLPWGFLTDGARWRLTHSSVAGRLDRFYEVNLVECLDSPNDEHVLWFLLFFSPAAYRPDADGHTLLDRIREGSLAYAHEVGEGLKDSVYEALELLARGFLRRGPQPLDVLHEECLTLLYRLLFLLYAEDRELLPVGDASYQPYSLRTLGAEIAARRDRGESWSRGGKLLWCHLRSLFDVVDRGDEDLGIPPYNGGLFDAGRHPLLAALEGPGDEALARAVDLLARTRTEQPERIDYRDLDIRHLGTIYEGLLEYDLRRAEKDRRIRTERGGRKKIVDVQPGEDVPAGELIRAGEVYCATGADERHVTGSFYTPDYIVEHAVRDALEPLTAGRTPDELLRLRVVDAAMGSGHFLLAATDFLARAYARACIDHGQAQAGEAEEDLPLSRRRVVEHCVYGVDLNPMAVELAKLALWLATMARDRPLTFLNLHLRAGNSLLGIPVERTGSLAVSRNGRKSRKAPEQAELPVFAQKFRGRLPVMINDVLTILARDTRTMQDVEVKEELEKAIDGVRAPFRDVADVQAMLLLPELAAQVDEAVERVRPADKGLVKAGGRALEKERDQNARLESGRLVELIERPAELAKHPLVELAQSERARSHWFHWQLVFPEVFFDRHGNPLERAGFDAVVGNPPWIRQETLKRDKAALEALYPEVFHGTADVYVFFVAAGMQLLAKGGRLELVLPNKWLKADYAEAMRRFLGEKCEALSLVDFGHAPVFPDADTFPSILMLAHKDGGAPELMYARIPREELAGITKGVHLTEAVRRNRFPVAKGQLREDGWYPVTPEEAALMDKLRTAGTPLGEVVGRAPVYGIKTGLNEAYLLDQATRDRLVGQDTGSEELLKPFLRGADVDRWAPVWGGEWMLVLPSSENRKWPWSTCPDDAAAEAVFKSTYPALHAHMSRHRQALRGREDQGRFWWELRSCDYYDEFSRPKIVYAQIQFHSCFALDADGRMLNDKAFFVPAADSSVAAVLNSRLLWWLLWRSAPRMKDEALALHAFFMSRLPIAAGCGEHVAAITQKTLSRRERAAQFLDWLRLEMELPKASVRVQSFWRLSEKGLAAELRKAGLQLSSAALARVRDEFAPAKAEVHRLWGEIRDLEHATQRLVHDAYHLAPDDIALVERTLPPRDPMRVLDEEFVPLED